jgi:hypothetical protein
MEEERKYAIGLRDNVDKTIVRKSDESYKTEPIIKEQIAK